MMNDTGRQIGHKCCDKLKENNHDDEDVDDHDSNNNVEGHVRDASGVREYMSTFYNSIGRDSAPAVLNDEAFGGSQAFGCVQGTNRVNLVGFFYWGFDCIQVSG